MTVEKNKMSDADRNLIEGMAAIDDAEQKAWNGMGVITGPTQYQMRREQLRREDKKAQRESDDSH